MAPVATERVGDRELASVASGPFSIDDAPAIRCSVARGTLVVVTDTATTEGYPGRLDSEEVLVECALKWLGSSGRDLPCVAMEIAFDAGGRPRLVLAVEDVDGARRAWEPWEGAPEHALQVQTLPCTVVTFTDLAGDSSAYDSELALLHAVRAWIRCHPDFAFEAVQMSHGPTGQPQAVVVGGGLTAS